MRLTFLADGDGGGGGVVDGGGWGHVHPGELWLFEAQPEVRS